MRKLSFMYRRFFVIIGLLFFYGLEIFAQMPKPAVAGNKVESIGLDMVPVPAGAFTMGNTAGKPLENDRPLRQVTLGSFYMGRTEVTQAHYKRVMGVNPSEFKDGTDAAGLPVEQVNWFAAVAFCNKLSQMEGLQPAYTVNGADVSCDFNADGYRLPTEAEWEYAAKGGSQGAIENLTYSGSNTIDEVAWYVVNSGDATHPVAQKKPNVLGLYDMAGNVWEWCWDWAGGSGSSGQNNPTGPATGSYRYMCGGSWGDLAGHLRSANRRAFIPTAKSNDVGFRVVRSKK